MLKKIVSAGQTGAGRAAFDTAIKFNLEHGQLESSSIEQNIIDSDGTVIISHGLFNNNLLLTKKIASRRSKPWCHIDLIDIDEFEGAVILHDFIDNNYIETLHVAGPDSNYDPFIYRSVKSIIETFIYMELMEREPEELKAEDIILIHRKPEKFCLTIEEAVKFLADSMHLRTRSIIANSTEQEIAALYFSLADTIKVKLGLDCGNNKLIEACRKEIRKSLELDIEDAVMIILKNLRKHLQKNHLLRVIN